MDYKRFVPEKKGNQFGGPGKFARVMRKRNASIRRVTGAKKSRRKESEFVMVG